MENVEELSPEKRKFSRLKMIIIILSILLVLGVAGLAARYIYLAYFAPTQATVTVPDNLIGEEESSAIPSEPSAVSSDETSPTDSSVQPAGATSHPAMDKSQARKLKLHQGKPGDNEKFEVRNMFPGDTETKYFCIKAYHNADITLFFRADVTEQTKSLGDVLHIKVTHLDTGKVLCDDLFSEIDGQEFSELLKKNVADETTAYYQIDVSLDTAVGNEYQAALLKADFEWYVKDEGGLSAPQTGDTTNLTLWIVLALASLLLMFLLLMTRRKEDEQHER